MFRALFAVGFGLVEPLDDINCMLNQEIPLKHMILSPENWLTEADSQTMGKGAPTFMLRASKAVAREHNQQFDIAQYFNGQGRYFRYCVGVD